MRESQLHRHIFRRGADLPGAFPDVLVGPGDDCAVVRPDGGMLLLKVDQVIEGRHFTAGTPVDLVARKAIARGISDIAAMGGRPAWSLVSVIMPPGFAEADELSAAVDRWGRAFGAPVVGGDVATGGTHAPLSLSVTVGGTPHPARGPVLRSDARAGDDLWVTGRIGHSFPSGRHLTFTPRVEQAWWLAETLGAELHAMIDVSDGLGRDAWRIGERSGVGIEFDAPAIPLQPDASGLESAIGDGEDYELLFAADPAARQALSDRWPWVDVVPCTRVGRITSGGGCLLVKADGERLEVGEAGWDH